MNKSSGKKAKVKCPSTKFAQENVKDELILNEHVNGVVNGLSPEEKFSLIDKKKQKQVNVENCQILDEQSVNGVDRDSSECNKQVKHTKKKKTKLKTENPENIVEEEAKMVQETVNIHDVLASTSKDESSILPLVTNTNCSTKEILDVVESLVSMQLEETNSNISTIEPCVQFKQYESEMQMPMIMKIIQKDLSEPYSIYTYRYFIHNWPKLCYLAMCDEKCVGAIVCKLDTHRKVIKRGYIAMLAVDKDYRKKRIGSKLVELAIEEMIKGDADEVVLETEVTNKSALQLYEKLGFVRDKRLFRYYLNGVDALRLKLWLR